MQAIVSESYFVYPFDTKEYGMNSTEIVVTLAVNRNTDTETFHAVFEG